MRSIVASLVAQVSNLLYRRASSLRDFRFFAPAQAVESPADWKSAIGHVGNLRYSRGLNQLALSTTQSSTFTSPASLSASGFLTSLKVQFRTRTPLICAAGNPATLRTRGV